MPRCRDCSLYDLGAAKSKSGAVLSNRVARCLWVSKEVLPKSVSSPRVPVAARWMEPNDNGPCGRFIKRDK